ncbi:MAG: DUF1330 domain-containing protein [Proteobacteria bacterium]|nr:DUF1330 domain-containing protein [Pseudomonadota bacterium]
MPAYVIADIAVSDPAKYEGYKALSPGAVEKFGGRFVARGGQSGVLEGDWKPGRLVVIEFPSYDKAQTFYTSVEYTAARRARAGATSRFNMVVVEGI